MSVHTPPPMSEELAAAYARACAHLRAGIGTLNERSLHSTLKFWLEPEESRHEVAIGRQVADIFDGERAVEVQTGGCYPLQKKLAALLAAVPVTVVLPLPHYKWVSWIDPDTGERGDFHRSPKRGGVWDALPELYWLREFWKPGATAHPLTVRVLRWIWRNTACRTAGATAASGAPTGPTGDRWRWWGSSGCEALPTSPPCCRPCPTPSPARIFLGSWVNGEWLSTGRCASWSKAVRWRSPAKRATPSSIG